MNRFALTLLIFIFLACEKQPHADLQGSLVFGEAYGFCVGDCAHFFKLTVGKLYQDNIERLTNEEPTFNEMALSNVRFEIARNLLRDFPQYLKNNPNQTIGCPDCADQGGIHLYYHSGIEKMYWHIDTAVDNQPEEIREYLAQVRAITAQLRK